MSFGFNIGAFQIGFGSIGLYGPENYKNEADQEIIGVKEAVLFWWSNYGTGTNSVAGGGFTATTFDTSAYSDGAIIKLNNNSGGDRKMKSCSITGKPVVRYSGEKGIIHDDFVDYESILRDGEKKLEFGNNYIVNTTQLGQLADFYWKANNYKRHVYELEIPGRCYWYSPGEWYTVQIGGAGDVEYIDSVCECFDVQVEGEAGGLGRTVVAFREVYENWTKDSGALARFLGSGSPKDKYNFARVLVASQYYPGPSDYRCDGTADQTEIQAAIDQVAGFGGGVVELTEGTFVTAAAIDITTDNIVLSGAGAKTIVQKNCSDFSLEVLGAAGTYIENIIIRNLQLTRSSADTNAVELLHIKYAKNVTLENLVVEDSYGDGIVLENCERVNLINCVVNGAEVSGVVLKQTVQAAILSCVITGCALGIEAITDDTTNMIDRGNCEDATSPMLSGETVPVTGNLTWARSAEQAHAGTYSFKGTFSAASGYVTLSDAALAAPYNDMHGLTAGKEYRFECWLYIPSSNITASELFFDFAHVNSAGVTVADWIEYPRAIYDNWQKIVGVWKIPDDAVEIVLFISGTATAANNDYFYVDDVVLYEGTFDNNGYIIDGNTVKNNYGDGIYVATNKARILNNICNDNVGRGIAIVGGERNFVADNTALGNGNLIENWTCETVARPFIIDDAASLSGCTSARSTAQYYDGSYSHKITQTDASTGEYRFCDNVTKNDMHGLYANQQYKLSAYVYRLATGSPTTAEVKLIVGYTTDAAGAWHETTGNIATDADAWALAETTNVNLANAVGAKALIRINAAASTGEYIFVDNIRLQPVGTHNLHSQNFYDAGSNTYIGV